MPAWSTILKDHQIAGVITYIRSEWGNKDLLPTKMPMVTTKMVAGARKMVGPRGVMSPDQLRALSLTYYDDPTTAPAGGATAPGGTATTPAMKK